MRSVFGGKGRSRHSLVLRVPKNKLNSLRIINKILTQKLNLVLKGEGCLRLVFKRLGLFDLEVKAWGRVLRIKS